MLYWKLTNLFTILFQLINSLSPIFLVWAECYLKTSGNVVEFGWIKKPSTEVQVVQLPLSTLLGPLLVSLLQLGFDQLMDFLQLDSIVECHFHHLYLG